MAASYSVIKTTADILETPGNGAAIGKNDSQLLYGETFAVDGVNGEWLQGISAIDGYEGHIHVSNLVPQAAEPTHFVDVKLTALYPQPDFKTRPLMVLSFLSRVTLTGEKKNGFVQMNKGWVFETHITPLSALSNKDPLETAMMFLGAPYLYGGRSILGVDCSGLVQLALMRTGHPCPRDSGPQSQNIGQPAETPQRGDFIFFKGHVGIMVDETNILNATARTMDVRIEPLSNLINFYGGITALRRL